MPLDLGGPPGGDGGSPLTFVVSHNCTKSDPMIQDIDLYFYDDPDYLQIVSILWDRDSVNSVGKFSFFEKKIRPTKFDF